MWNNLKCFLLKSLLASDNSSWESWLGLLNCWAVPWEGKRSVSFWLVMTADFAQYLLSVYIVAPSGIPGWLFLCLGRKEQVSKRKSELSPFSIPCTVLCMLACQLFSNCLRHQNRSNTRHDENRTLWSSVLESFKLWVIISSRHLKWLLKQCSAVIIRMFDCQTY